ncbi:hypothetical protein [Saccharopolyspora hattusasensis]|uniref:hypothetical protein n=1 Tax=Saccharopolyspora hattusasensis TaxID=1128679 RepID=UPI003D965FF5
MSDGPFTPDQRDTLDHLVDGTPLRRPDVSDAARIIGYAQEMLAESLDHPYTLRTATNGQDTLHGLHTTLTATHDALEQLVAWYQHATERGDLNGDTASVITNLHAAMRALGNIAEPLQGAAAEARQISDNGTTVGSYEEQVQGVMAELQHRGATILRDPLAEDLPDLGVGFSLPEDPETYLVLFGPEFGDLPVPLMNENVHPVVLVDYIVGSLATYTGRALH